MSPFAEDRVGAFVPHGRCVVEASGRGPLDGLAFAVKDVFDVAGVPTGAGNPRWLATHPIPSRHAAVVERLLDAGARLTGKTVTDELAYSIHGDNIHYGMPLNSAAPDAIPGGSSSGSVAAVAAGLVDFALGTDTGGSTRVPASYCGLWGIRTTHGLVSCEGLVPLHPGFDTATWFARDAVVFKRVGQVLLPPATLVPRRLVWLADAITLADPDFQEPLHAVAEAAASVLGVVAEPSILAADGLEAWRQTYVAAGAFEGWQVHGAWIESAQPDFAPAIAARWRAAAQVTSAQAASAREDMARIRAHVRACLGSQGIAILPSAASVAPARDADASSIEETRVRTLRISCIAGLSGLPQVSMPLRTREGMPAGVSLLGPAGSDLALIELATRVHARLRSNSAGRE